MPTETAAADTQSPMLGELVTMTAVMMTGPPTKRSSSQTASMLNAGERLELGDQAADLTLRCPLMQGLQTGCGAGASGD
ncbi:hypothetical protein AMK22_11005 [Streptomyces sp. CB01580]|nr:hypothetical protein AMK22_11005 [Streptomyces sp. CB01580]